MKTWWKGFVFAVGAGLVVGPAARSAMVVTSVDRSVEVAHIESSDQATNNTTGFWVDSVSLGEGAAVAEQNTLVDPANFTLGGSGGALIADFDEGFPSAASLFEVAFSLDQPHSFSMIGEVGSGFEVGSASAEVTLFDSFSVAIFTFSGTPFNENGVLAAGDYLLVATAEASYDTNTGNGLADASFEFVLQLEPLGPTSAIPEPGTALLGMMGLGLLALGRRRIRQTG